MIFSGVMLWRSPEAAQRRYDAPHKRTRQTAAEIRDCGTFAYFGQCRVGHHHFGESPDIEALSDRQGPGYDQLARVSAHDGGPENAPASRRDHLDVTAGLALRLGAVVLVVGPAQHADAPSGLRLGQSHMGE